jgi:hypothetical protein
MSITIAQAMKLLEDLQRELSVWQEVEVFLNGFVRQEEQDSVRKVITTEPWNANGCPPASIVVPEDVVKDAIRKVRLTELEPRQRRIASLQNLSIKEEVIDGVRNECSGTGAEENPEEEHKLPQRKSKGAGKGNTKPRRAKPKVAAEDSGSGKTNRCLIPKPEGIGEVGKSA